MYIWQLATGKMVGVYIHMYRALLEGEHNLYDADGAGRNRVWVPVFLRAMRDSLCSLMCERVFIFKLSENGGDTGDYGKVYVILYLKNAACMLLDYAGDR